ncbi:Uncharacterised protein [Rhodococcus gordoniae]|uniref:Uncharacterized protein n=1 Tax=Rhodococcus gordoniae TaxID=223392 RepID=A0A379M2R9_9NOCA|nr:Uncharacterised protein [Rhodococcus gordoniae]
MFDMENVVVIGHEDVRGAVLENRDEIVILRIPAHFGNQIVGPVCNRIRSQDQRIDKVVHLVLGNVPAELTPHQHLFDFI